MRSHRFAFHAMASACEVTVAAASPAQAQAWADVAIAEVRRIEATFSRYRADSIVSRINAAAGLAAVPCDEETWSLLGYAEHLHAASDGLFDITSGVLRRAWNFAEPRLPSPQALQALLNLVGWSRVELHHHTVRLPLAGMELDFGGFGKEYAADRAASAMAAEGARHGYVNLAGDLRVIGPKPDGQAWAMGIQHPRRKGHLLATIPVVAGGLATSGDYERGFDLDGRRYCHVLDPRSGWPVQHWQSVSVTAPLAVAAGSASTIAMLKQAQGLEFLRASGLPFLAVDQGGAVHVQAQPAA